jgi:hypothetical protein
MVPDDKGLNTSYQNGLYVIPIDSRLLVNKRRMARYLIPGHAEYLPRYGSIHRRGLNVEFVPMWVQAPAMHLNNMGGAQ